MCGKEKIPAYLLTPSKKIVSGGVLKLMATVNIHSEEPQEQDVDVDVVTVDEPHCQVNSYYTNCSDPSLISYKITECHQGTTCTPHCCTQQCSKECYYCSQYNCQYNMVEKQSLKRRYSPDSTILERDEYTVVSKKPCYDPITTSNDMIADRIECREEKVKYSPVIRPVPFRQQQAQKHISRAEDQIQPTSPNLQSKSFDIGSSRGESAFQIPTKKSLDTVSEKSIVDETESDIDSSPTPKPFEKQSTTMQGIQRFFQTSVKEKNDSEYTISIPNDQKNNVAIVKPLLINFAGWKKPEQIDMIKKESIDSLKSWPSASSIASTGAESVTQENDDSDDCTEQGKRKRNKEASRQYREKRKMAVKDVFNKQRDLEKRNKELHDELAKMQEMSECMQRQFASEINTKEKIKSEIVKLIKRSNEKERSVVEEEVNVMQKIFQHVADDNLTKGCVENAIYEIWGEVLKGEN